MSTKKQVPKVVPGEPLNAGPSMEVQKNQLVQNNPNLANNKTNQIWKLDSNKTQPYTKN